MFRSRFFWKLYASYAALVLVTSVAIGGLVLEQVGRSRRESLRETLRAECVLLRPIAEQSKVSLMKMK